ncbi:MAG: NUDIX domain-containing protein [Vicinamibacteria bacterium]|nr:NUDIX domain-containing protein [Vicinamibacteria bacterium]
MKITDVPKFCSLCGGSLSSHALEEGRPARLACSKCDFVFRLDPKLLVCVVVVRNGKVVLLQRAVDPGRGKWVFPGGFVERGETVQTAAVRETLRKTGLRVSLTGILDVYSYAGHDIVVVVYVADDPGGEIRLKTEGLAAACFAPEDVPWNELAFPSTRDALRDFMRRFYPRVRLPR